MRIVLISTFRQSCGIATYTEQLAPALKALGHEVYVLAERIKPQVEKGEYNGIKYIRIWTRNKFHEELPEAIERLEADRVHIQHEFGLFPNTNALLALSEKDLGRPVYLTAHTPIFDGPQVGLMRQLEEFTGTLIHHPLGADLAKETSPRAVVHYVPHGVAPINLRKDPKEIYWFCPGFISPRKGYDEILESFVRYAPDGVKLIIAGKIVEGQYDYYRHLDNMITTSGANVELRGEYLSDVELTDLIYNAKRVILSTDPKHPHSPFSASGQLHTAIGCLTPIVARFTNIYTNAAGCVSYFLSRDELDELFASWYPGCACDEVSIANSRRVREERSWDKVAKMHEEIYQ